MNPVVTRTATAVLAVAAVATAWVFFGPAQLGGATHYAIIEGTSMEPALSSGDLAVVRSGGDVDPGDVVLYRDPGLRVDVLHRVVRAEGSGFVLKGDNNDFLDDAQPTESEIEGALWFTAPYAGTALAWVRQPLHAALFVFVLAVLAFAGGSARRRAPATIAGAATALKTGSIAAICLFGLLALAAFTRSATSVEAVPEARVHEGTFSYSARVGLSDVYPDGRVDTGEAAFVELVPALRVAFAYRFSSEDTADIRGSTSLSAVLSDGAGWERHIALAAPRPFTGPEAEVTGRLDLARLSEIVDEMQELTGSGTTTFSVRIEPRVEVVGRVGEDALDDTFSPQLPLLLDSVSLRPDAPDDGSSPLTARETEEGTTIAAAHLAFAGLRLSVAEARRLAVLGLLVSFAVLAACLVASWARGTDGEHVRVASRLQDRMITIAGVPTVDPERVTELGDAESLTRVAEMHDRVVLHWRQGGSHVYLVEDGSMAYRYRIRPRQEVAVAAAELEDTLVL